MNGLKLILEEVKKTDIEFSLNEYNQDDDALLVFNGEQYDDEDGIYFEIDVDKEWERVVGGTGEYGTEEVYDVVENTINIRIKQVLLFGLEIDLNDWQHKELKQELINKIEGEI